MSLFAVLARQRQLFIQHKKGILLVLYTVSFVLYLGLGGMLFLMIEGPQIENSQKGILDVKAIIMKKYPEIPAEALDDYLSEIRAIGVRGLPSAKGKVIKWTFADGVFFSTTLLTTIGYGHVTPKSVLGKIVCILYTGIGIPMTLLLLSAYVERLMKISESYKAVLFFKFEKVFKPTCIRLTHITTIMALILLLCFILPALFYSHFEKGWNTFDGLYFCFISLTTVGLGDLVPALDPDMPHAELYKYATIFYMIAGVTIMMFMMAMTADFHENYNCNYEILPFTIPSEKIPIYAKSAESYGTLLIESGKSEKTENHTIMKSQK